MLVWFTVTKGKGNFKNFYAFTGYHDMYLLLPLTLTLQSGPAQSSQNIPIKNVHWQMASETPKPLNYAFRILPEKENN